MGRNIIPPPKPPSIRVPPLLHEGKLVKMFIIYNYVSSFRVGKYNIRHMHHNTHTYIQQVLCPPRVSAASVYARYIYIRFMAER